MPKPKASRDHKASKSKSKEKHPITPETADDVLAAGVDFEEAGEKWRSGDTAKSSRFFIRALDTYENGLHRFPKSFDLAYNRARLFFSLTQQPRHLAYIHSTGMKLLSISDVLPSAATDLLYKALYFHQYALELNSENADAIFNMAQIHTSLAEAINDDQSLQPGTGSDALYHLEKAVELFERCLAIQRSQLSTTEEAINSSFSQELQQEQSGQIEISEDISAPPEEPQAETEEQWASVEATVTEATLLDTSVAEMEALTTMINLLSSDEPKLQIIEEKVASLVHAAEGYKSRLNDDSAGLEFDRAKAKAAATLLLASFKLGRITAEECSAKLDTTFLYSGRESDAEALSESAESRIEFNSACIARSVDALSLQWHQLSVALTHLSTAAGLPRVASVWLLHSRKADVELYRCRLAEAPFNYEPARSNRDIMRKNAEVFYRGARKIASAAGEQEFADDMASRERVVQQIQGQSIDRPIPAIVVREMMEEGLLIPA